MGFWLQTTRWRRVALYLLVIGFTGGFFGPGPVFGDDFSQASQELKNVLKGQATDQITVILNPDGARKAISFTVTELLSALSVLDSLSRGELQKAAEQGLGAGLSRAMPACGLYLGLHQAVKVSIEGMIANWTQDLYQVDAYEILLDLVNREVLDGARKGHPYIPSPILNNAQFRIRMKAREDRLYQHWNSLTAVNTGLLEDDTAALLRQVLGHDSRDNKEVFDLFLREISRLQKDQFLLLFRREVARQAQQKKQQLAAAALAALDARTSIPEDLFVRANVCGENHRICVEYGGKVKPESPYMVTLYLYKGETQVDSRLFSGVVARTEALQGTHRFDPVEERGLYRMVLSVSSEAGKVVSVEQDFQVEQTASDRTAECDALKKKQAKLTSRIRGYSSQGHALVKACFDNARSSFSNFVSTRIRPLEAEKNSLRSDLKAMRARAGGDWKNLSEGELRMAKSKNGQYKAVKAQLSQARAELKSLLDPVKALANAINANPESYLDPGGYARTVSQLRSSGVGSAYRFDFSAAAALSAPWQEALDRYREVTKKIAQRECPSQ